MFCRVSQRVTAVTLASMPVVAAVYRFRLLSPILATLWLHFFRVFCPRDYNGPLGAQLEGAVQLCGRLAAAESGKGQRLHFATAGRCQEGWATVAHPFRPQGMPNGPKSDLSHFAPQTDAPTCPRNARNAPGRP